MINFKKKGLYEREQTRLDLFLKNKLVTDTEQQELEYQKRLGIEDTSMDMDMYLAGDTIDTDGIGYEGDDGYGSFGGAGDRSGVKGSTSWQQEGQPLLTFIQAPMYMVRYIFTDMVKDFPKKEEWKGIIKAFNVGNMISISVAIIELLIGINNIFSPIFQLTAGIVMFLITTTILAVVYKEDTYLVQFIKKFLGKEQEDGEFTFSDDEEYSIDEEFKILGEDTVEGINEDSNLKNNIIGDKLDGGFGFTEEVEDTFNGLGNLGEDDDIVDEGYIEEEYDEDVPKGKDRLYLAESSISTETDEEFAEDLLKVFKRGSKYQGREITGRVDLIHSFSDYLIQNDRSFGKWKRPVERGVEYNNIAYSIFKGLVGIERQFGRYAEPGEEEDKMVVVDIRKSPLLYRIELELPSYFTEVKLKRNIKVIEDMLRKSEDDTEVSVIISSFKGNYVIKLLRLDSKQLVSLGDILRFYDEEKGYVGMESYDDDSKGLPVLFGLQNNEFPYMVDMEENTSGVIVGGSGSGKSWATFEIMLNLVTTNDYSNVNFIILDAKSSSFWKSFAKFPHVLGHHTEPFEYLEILTEVEEERKRRQLYLNSLNMEDAKGYRKKMRKEGRHEELNKMPLLYVVLDEITATMAELKDSDEELFKSVSNLLGIISQKGRSAGVRILSIGQRSTYDSIPKSLMANSSFKFGMKMNVENDFGILLGDEVKGYPLPNTTGMGLSKVDGVMGMHTVKTLTVGGKNDDQMLMLVRVLALDWVRRSYGRGDFTQQPEGMNFNHAFNRNKFYTESIRDLEEGRILSPLETLEEYKVVFKDDIKDIEDIEYTEKEDKEVTEKTEDKEDKVLREDKIEEEVAAEEDLEKKESVTYNEKTGYKEEDLDENKGYGKIENVPDIEEVMGEIVKDRDTKDLEEILEGQKQGIVEDEKLDFNSFGFGTPETVTEENVVNEDREENLEEQNEGKFNFQDLIGYGEEEKVEDEEENGTENSHILDIYNFKNIEEPEIEEKEPENLIDILNILDTAKIKNTEKLGTRVNENTETEIDAEIDEIKNIENNEKENIKEDLDTDKQDIDTAEGYTNTAVKSEGSGELLGELLGKTSETGNLGEENVDFEKKVETSQIVHPGVFDGEVFGNDEKEDDFLGEDIQYEKQTIERKIEYQIVTDIENNHEGIETPKNKNIEEAEKEVELTELTELSIEGEIKDIETKTNIDIDSIKNIQKHENMVGNVEIDFAADVGTRKTEPGMSVKKYVQKYGSRIGFNKAISKEELEEVYEMSTIQKSLERMSIIEKDDDYITEM